MGYVAPGFCGADFERKIPITVQSNWSASPCILNHALRKAGELSIVLSIVSLFILAGCGGGASKSNTGATSSIIQLSGTNGDMSKYLGIWISGCGIKYNLVYNPSKPTQPTVLSPDGVINKFDMTAVSGASVQGIMTTSLYAGNTFCSGSAVQSVSTISLQYVSNVAVTNQPGANYFVGMADRVDLSVVGASGVVSYDFAFRQNFSRFQLKSAGGYFSIADLLYNKQ